ncbi:MAG: peptidylprolyl isomerase [Candidatus Kapaibacterium sp.]
MTFNNLKILAVIAIIFIASGLISSAQEERVDEIVAVVGNEIVMLSELNDQVRAMAYQDPSVNPDDPELRRQVLESIINEKLVVARAVEDSIEVSQEEITQQMDDLVKSLIMRYGSEKRVEDVYQMSISRLKYEYKEEIRKTLLANKIRQQKFGNIKVTPKEVENFYNEYKDSLQTVPASMELYHIVRNIRTDETAKEDIYKLATRVRDSIISGGDFAEFAKRYSAQSGTAAAGGDLGWVQRGKFFPEFEEAAYKLQPGEVSYPVETPLGFHLIETIEKREDAIHARHILFKLGQSTADREKAKEFLLDIKKRVEGGEDFKELAKGLSEDQETRGFGGKIGKISEDQLTPQMREALNKIEVGEVTDPIQYAGDPTKPAMHIIYKADFNPAHEPDLEQDYDIIEQKAMMVKRLKLYDKWVQELRDEMYWEIKEN